MPSPNQNSLNDDKTGSDFLKLPRNQAQSLGDQSTAGDAVSSISDLRGGFDGADDGMEIVDLSGRYEVQGTLGRGGMGDVVLAYDKRIKRRVAIKRILGEMADNRRAFQRFLTEAQSVGALNHPNIVQVIDFGRDREGPFLILEYVEGGTLLKKLEAGPLQAAEAIRLSCQVLDGLITAHKQGIIHRDIKPANILLTSRGDAKLTDFGLARQEQSDMSLTSTGAVLGTFDYMPPEQLKNAALVDSRSDLWSLAATLYQMVTGKSPKIIKFNEVPQSLQDVLGKALEDNKEDRYQSAAEFRDALLAADKPQATGGETLAEGECTSCHTINATDRKFCKQCGTSLVDPCLSCQFSVPVWEKFCGSCGKKVKESTASYLSQLEKESVEIGSLIQNYRYTEAFPMLEKMAAIQDHRFGKFAEWAGSSLVSIREEASRKREEAANLYKAAEEASNQCQFTEAAKYLCQIPEPLQDADAKRLLDSVRTKQARLKLLHGEITSAVKAKQIEGLLGKVEEYLLLRPTDGNAMKLAERLRKSRPQVAMPLENDPALPLDKPIQPGISIGRKIKKGPVRIPPFAMVGAGLVVVAIVAVFAMSGRFAGKTELEDLKTGDGKVASKTELKSGDSKVARKTELEELKTGDGKVAKKTEFEGLKAGDRKELVPGMYFRWCPPGTFIMGESALKAGNVSNNNQVEVTLTRGFWLGETEVTQAQWDKLMGTTPWKGRPSTKEGPNYPATHVNYNDAMLFIKTLNTQEQRASQLPNGWKYTLPTEAQWEYACRAGTKTKYSFGDDETQLGSYAWYDKNAAQTNESYAHEVRTKKANNWGLHDMHGNVSEWCSHSYDEYPKGPVSDPVGPKVISDSVSRGGSWGNEAEHCRSAIRGRLHPLFRYGDLGFRVALSSSGIPK